MLLALSLTVTAMPKDFKFPKAPGSKPDRTAKNRTDLTKQNSFNLEHYQEGAVWIKIKPSVKAPKALADKSLPAGKFGLKTLDGKLEQINADKVVQSFYGSNPSKTVLEKRPYLNNKTDLPDLSRIYLVTFSKDVNPLLAAAILRADENVEYASPVTIHTTNAVPNDALYQNMAHLPQVLAPEAWDIHKGENGEVEILVGINDSGVDWNHPDLLPNLYQNLAEDANGNGATIVYDDVLEKWALDPGDLDGIDADGNGFVDDLIGWNFTAEMDNSIPNDPHAITTNPHGTHVAGIAAGATNNGIGIASISWNVKFLPTKHGLNYEGRSIHFAYDGLIYLANMGCDVINCSWGGGQWDPVAQDVIDYCNAMGSVIIASAGNSNSEVPNYPGSYRGVVSVASVASNDQKATYSTYGIPVDISAPGGNRASDNSVLSTFPDNGYAVFNGTSMAAPLAAGAFALLKSYYPDWSNYELKRQLIATTDNIENLNQNYQGKLGSGRINAYRMLTEQNPTVDNSINLDIVHYEVQDGNDNMLFPGEQANLMVFVRNYSDIVGGENFVFNLSTNNPYITVLTSSVTADLPYDNTAILSFTINVSPMASYGNVSFNLDITPSQGITLKTGNNYNFEVFLFGAEVFVYNPFNINYGEYGKFIADFYNQNGITALHTDQLPPSFLPFSAVYILGGDMREYTLWKEDLLNILINYIVAGGKVYLESSDIYELLSAINSPQVNFLLGIGGGEIAEPEYRGMEELTGSPVTLTNGMNFENSEQFIHPVDKIFGNNFTGFTAFNESGYGPVAVQNIGIFGQRTFLSSYSIAALVDNNDVSNRYELLYRIANFLGLEMEGYVGANFTALPTAALQSPATVMFQANVYSTEEIDFYAWDLDGDGLIDSFDPEPVWTYYYPAMHNVTLSVYTVNDDSFTLTKEKAVSLFMGETGVKMADKYPSFLLAPVTNESLNITDDFTFECWLGVEETFKFSPFPQLFDNGPIWIWIDLTGKVMVDIFHANQTGTYAETLPEALPFYDYNHIAVSYNNTIPEIKIYINGNEAPLNPDYLNYGSGPLWSANDNQPIFFGMLSRLAYGSDPFDGVMDEIRVWKKARTQKEIQYGMHDQYLTNVEGLGAYWRLNDPGYEYSFDQSGNDNMIYAYKTRWFWGKEPEFTINPGNQSVCEGAIPFLGSHYVNLDNEVVCNTAVGGSGDYTYYWYPNTGLNFTFHQGNPYDPFFSGVKNYYLQVTDNNTGAQLSKNITVAAGLPPTISLPLIRTCRTGNSINLGDQLSVANATPPLTYFWTNKLGWTSDAENPSITPAASMRYYLTVTDSKGCVSAEKRVHVVVGNNFPKEGIILTDNDIIQGSAGDIVLTSYPNPAGDEVTLFADFAVKGDAKISIVDITGRTIRSFTRYNAEMLLEQINISDLTAGTYMFTISINGETYSRKFLKK